MAERAKKRPRTTASRKAALEITPRDLDLLLLLGLVGGYATADQLGRDLFPSQDRTRRRLRQLFDAGLVTVKLTSSRAPNLVCLARQGLALLASRLGEEATARLRLPGPVNLATLDHHLGIVDARLYAAALGASCNRPLLSWSSGRGDLARELGLGEHHLEPDGVCAFEGEAGPRFVAVEVDTGSEGLWEVDSKLGRYALPLADGDLHGLWFVVVGGGAKREGGLRQLVAEAGLPGVVELLPRRLVTERPVVAPPRWADLWGGTALGPKARKQAATSSIKFNDPPVFAHRDPPPMDGPIGAPMGEASSRTPAR